jgi:pimeloyl-ACP methyl ester carboxylesterase
VRQVAVRLKPTSRAPPPNGPVARDAQPHKAAPASATTNFQNGTRALPAVRKAATVNLEHDVADRRNGRRIACPLLALWSGRGPLNAWYTNAGEPVAIWRALAHDVRGGSVDAGHFFPEELPDDVADALTRFFASKRSAR